MSTTPHATVMMALLTDASDPCYTQAQLEAAIQAAVAKERAIRHWVVAHRHDIVHGDAGVQWWPPQSVGPNTYLDLDTLIAMEMSRNHAVPDHTSHQRVSLALPW